MIRSALIALISVSIVSTTFAADDAEKVDRKALLEAVRPSAVVVEYHLRFDKGEAPRGAFVHSVGNFPWQRGVDAEGLIGEERPLETAGFVLGDSKTVVTADHTIADRFIEKIVVRKGGDSVGAKRSAVGLSRAMLALELDAELPGAKPLVFAPGAEGPYQQVLYHDDDGEWEMGAIALSEDVVATDAGRVYRSVRANTVIVSGKGEPVGFASDSVIPADDTWKGSPLDARKLTEAEYRALGERVGTIADGAILRVTLNFRSPRKDEAESFGRFARGGEADTATELHVPGVVIGPNRVLVVANLKAKTTARLERIRVFNAAGEATGAQFVATLKDYGLIVAETEKPMPDPIAVTDRELLTYRGELLFEALVRIQGEQRTRYVSHERIAGFERGWKRQVYPSAGKADGESFLVDSDGKLVAFPLARREKAGAEDWRRGQTQLTSVRWIASLLDKLDEHADPNNIPLSEEEANRVAWLGMVLQPLDQDLARLNNVADLTQDGRIGGLVTYVYAGSPAAEAGIEPGAIFLRVHPENHPKPIDVQVEEDHLGGRPFPWDRLDELPEEYFDRIPMPWSSVDTHMAKTLTELGWGTAFTADFVVEGERVSKPFKVVAGPTHYNSAKRYESKPLGVTVRDLTYEVRRYLQMTNDDPGVVISKIEPGSKVSIAGVKPYELIIAINDTPIKGAADFEKAVTDATGEMRLTIKRITRNRQAVIKLDGKPDAKDEAKDEPAEVEKPAEEAPAEAPAAPAE